VLRGIFGLRREGQHAGENCLMGSFIICNRRQNYQYCQVKEDEMGMGCSTHGREEECRKTSGKT
jgi:hypothetical protein